MSDKRKFVNGLLSGLLLAVIIVSATFAGREAVAAWKEHKGTESAAADEVVNARTMQKLQLIEELIEDRKSVV